MALSSFVGSFTSLTTDAVNTTYTLTPGFTTKAGILFWTGRGDTSDASGRASVRRGFGFFTSTSNRVAAGTTSIDAAAAGSGSLVWHNAACVATVLEDATTINGLIDVSAITSTQVTFILDDVLPANLTIGVMLFGGDDITNATIVEFDGPATPFTSTQDITTVGFQGDMLFLLGTSEIAAAPSSNAAAAVLMLGACTGTTDEHVWLGGMDQGSTSADTGSYSFAGDLIANQGATVNSPLSPLRDRANFSAWLSNGFQLQWLQNGRGSVNYFALVIKGGKWTVGDFTTRTTTGTIVETGFGYDPNGVLVISDGKAQATADTTSINDRLSVGAASGSVDHAQAMLDEDGPANMEVTTAIDFSQVYVNIDTASAIEGLIDLQSFDVGGLTFNQSDADANAYFAWYVACGSTPAGGGAVAPYYSSYYTRMVAA